MPPTPPTIRRGRTAQRETSARFPVSLFFDFDSAELLRQAHSAYNHGSYQKAIELCEQVRWGLDVPLVSSVAWSVAAVPTPIGWVILESKCQNGSLWDIAPNRLTQVEAADPTTTDNLLLLGATYFQLRNFSKCILYNQRAIEINPEFAEAFGNLGNALKELGDPQAAIHFYLKAISLQPKFAGEYCRFVCHWP